MRPPAKINAIIQDVLVAPIKLAKNVFRLRDPCNVANINPPITPKDAASVGVAQPIYISQQDDAWPMWIPQMSMVIGTLILAIAFLDRLYQIIFFDWLT